VGQCTVSVNAAKTETAVFALDPVEAATPAPTPTPAPAATPAPTAKAPDTRLVKATIKAFKRTATFTFKAVGTAKSHHCALTARGKKVAYKTCRSPVTFKKLKVGRYTFRVQAVGAAGTDPTPASKTITIR
jgi:hypothetical protein